MSHQGLLIDPQAFTRESRRVEGRRAVAGFERLAKAVFDPAGDLDFAVTGSVDSGGKRWLVIEVSGVLVLQCQRCLEPMRWNFAHSGRLLLVPEGQVLPDEGLEEDDWDPVAVGSRVDLRELIEDEVLLGLPIAPRHEQECVLPSPGDGGDDASPFASLARLRKTGGA